MEHKFQRGDQVDYRGGEIYVFVNKQWKNVELAPAEGTYIWGYTSHNIFKYLIQHPDGMPKSYFMEGKNIDDGIEPIPENELQNGLTYAFVEEDDLTPHLPEGGQLVENPEPVNPEPVVMAETKEEPVIELGNEHNNEISQSLMEEKFKSILEVGFTTSRGLKLVFELDQENAGAFNIVNAKEMNAQDDLDFQNWANEMGFIPKMDTKAEE